jgi:NAD(P)H dehydrogenase (quinone)
MKQILIINGHPNPDSLCHAIVDAYQKGALEVGATCRVIHLCDLQFDPILKFGYRKRTELEPDLLIAQESILAASHIVFVYPNWWGTFPALLKGFIDRTFLPGFAFQYREGSPFWDKLLKGKTASLLITTDTPNWYNWLFYKRAGQKVMQNSVF